MRRRLSFLLSLAVCGALLSTAAGARPSRLQMKKGPEPRRSKIRMVGMGRDSAFVGAGRVPFPDFLLPSADEAMPGALRQALKTRHRTYPVGGSPLRTAQGRSGRAVLGSPAGDADTIRVLGIRVDFATDRGGALTTSDGKFDLRSSDEVLAPESLVDPPPHNRDYFLAHFRALSNYYAAQSYGQLVIKYDVYPAEQDSAYHLTDAMDYGPWTLSQDSLIVRAARDVLIDAISEADSSSDIDFGDYDAYIVFHAGPDFQSDINRDSPRDIPSYTISLLEDSVSVNNGENYVHMGMVLPETSTQDGFLGALNGVLAHEFGHILGLPDLYDIKTFFPVVGDFSLMDSGNMLQGVLEDSTSGDLYAVYGMLPSSLDLWSKAILWPETIDLKVVDDQTDVELEAIENAPEGLFVLINSEEYFLIENRQVDLDADSTVVLKADSTTGVVLGPESNEYDFLLPGTGGVLIWHIDESAIFGRNVGPFSGVNSNRRRRGIKLEEADGIEDIGNIFSIYFTGSPEEAFYLSNNALFSTDTNPSSTSNSGGYSHVTVEILDDPASQMHVIARREWGGVGWPVWLKAPIAEGSPWAGLSGARGEYLGFVTGDSVLHIGEPEADWRHVDVKLPAMPVPGISWRPLKKAGTGIAYVSVPGTGVLAFGPDGTPPAGWSTSLPEVCTAPTILDAGVLVGLDDGSVARLEDDGRIAWRAGGGGGSVISPLSAEDLDGDGAPEVAFATQGGKVWMLEANGSVAAGWPVQWRDGVVWLAAADMDGAGDPRRMELLLADSTGTVEVMDGNGSVRRSWKGRDVRISGGRPALADVDGDGFLECAFVSESGNLYLMNHNGTIAANWPFRLGGGSSADSIRWVSSPVMADVDDDGVPEVICGSLSGDVVALDDDGSMCEGWPYSFGLPVRSSPLVYDISLRGRISLVVGGDDGVLHCLFTNAPLGGGKDAPWPRYGGGASLANAFPTSLMGEPVLAAELIPAASVYVYPSPVTGDRAHIRYDLSEEAAVVATVIDIRGQEIALLRQTGYPGENELTWNTGKLGAGLYFIRVAAESSTRRTQTRTIKVALAR